MLDQAVDYSYCVLFTVYYSLANIITFCLYQMVIIRSGIGSTRHFLSENIYSIHLHFFLKAYMPFLKAYMPSLNSKLHDSQTFWIYTCQSLQTCKHFPPKEVRIFAFHRVIRRGYLPSSGHWRQTKYGLPWQYDLLYPVICFGISQLQICSAIYE